MKYNKMDGMLVLEVVDSNPNGDPDYLGNPDNVIMALGKYHRSP